VLVYNIGIQSKTGSTSMQSTLDAGLKEQYRQFVSVLGADLGIGKLPY
jgi:hypothetical protein